MAQFDWKPHDRSMTLGRLAEHLAQLPEWAALTLDTGRHRDGTTGRPTMRPPAPAPRCSAMFDQNVAKARAALHGRTDAELMAPWTLTAQGKEVFTMPKASVLRTL